MGYVKPGIEIRQVQQSQTPILTEPDLTACIVGHAYWWQDPTWEQDGDALHNSQYSDVVGTKYTGSELTTVAISGMNPTYYDVSDSPSLTVVDLLCITPPTNNQEYRGARFHLEYTRHFSITGNVITISGSVDPYYNGSRVTLNTGSYNIILGYRAAMPVASGYNDITRFSDIESTIGTPVSWNPLGFGALLALNNANTSLGVLGLNSSVDTDNEIKAAIDDNLSLREVYVVAPVIHGLTGASMKSHVEGLSLPENKKERIGLVNSVISYGKKATETTSTERTTLAGTIAGANSTVGSKRVFSTHPDAGFVEEVRHITTVNPEWINNSFNSKETTINFSANGPYAKLLSTVTLPGGRATYKAGTEITAEVWANLHKYSNSTSNKTTDANGNIRVLAPVPGFYYNAVIAGQVIGTSPSQPLTNFPSAGISRTWGSQDIFSEAQLNIIGGGGTYIMVQNSDSAPITSRHQKSTDITSVAKAELSITKAVDYTAKFIRNILNPYIGRTNITNGLLSLIRAAINGAGTILIRNGYISDLVVNTVVQDELNPDTILVEVSVLPLYPANYIKITLLF